MVVDLLNILLNDGVGVVGNDCVGFCELMGYNVVCIYDIFIIYGCFFCDVGLFVNLYVIFDENVV